MALFADLLRGISGINCALAHAVLGAVGSL
jgi:hypothetical protein